MTKGTEGLTSVFGAGNLLVKDTPENVTIQFDPRVIIGAFGVSAAKKADAVEAGRPEPIGNPKVASTGSYRTLDISGVRVMLHVIGRATA